MSYCHFFQQHFICSLYVFASHLVTCAVFQTFSLLLYLLSWSVIFDIADTTTCWRLQWWLAPRAIRHFLYRHVHFLRHAIAQVIDDCILNITFICTGKPKKKMMWLSLLQCSLYCGSLELHGQHIQCIPVNFLRKTWEWSQNFHNIEYLGDSL